MSDKNNRKQYFSALPDFDAQAIEEKRKQSQPKAPSFSLSDMEDARKSAFDEGFQNGLEQAKNSIEQRIELAIQSLAENIHKLQSNEHERAQKSQDIAVYMASKTLNHLISPLLDDTKHDLLMKALDHYFSESIQQSPLSVTLNPDMKDAFAKYIPMLSPDLIIKNDENYSMGQITIEWQDGHYNYSADDLFKTIQSILNDTLNDQGIAHPEEIPEKTQDTFEEKADIIQDKEEKNEDKSDE